MADEVLRSRVAREAAEQALVRVIHRSQAYARQMLLDHPDLDATTLAADAVLSVGEFHRTLFTE